MRTAPLAIAAAFAATPVHAAPAPVDAVFARLEATGALENPCFAIATNKRLIACATHFYIKDLDRTVFSVERFAAAGVPREQAAYASPDGHRYERTEHARDLLEFIRSELERDHFTPFVPSFRELSDRGRARVAGHVIARTGDRITCDGTKLWLAGLGVDLDRATFAIAEPMPGVSTPAPPTRSAWIASTLQLAAVRTERDFAPRWCMPDERDRDRDAATDPIVTEMPASTAAQLATLAGKFPERYRLAGTLGTGGMGEVILATDTQIGREVAIKRMRLEPSAGSIARFEREAKIQARLEHPAIVPVHELANDAAGQPFFVMKRLAGTTLYDVIVARNARFSRNKLLRSFADACLAIELAHSRGIVHRDLKPNNIMLGDFGETYVLDWGIARVLGEADTIEPAWRDTSVGGATQVGAIFGTPGYIAPEMLRGQPVDGRADVYALGCILFEILAGEPLLPPGRSGMTAALDDVDARPSVRAPDREIPLELDSICVDATRTDRDLRLPTARSLADRVEHFLDGDRDHAQRKALAEGHLATARAAIAAGDSAAQRALAMREAGSALALDPTGGDAAELVGRLMLEPPREVPREVEDRLAELDDRARRTKLAAVWPAHLMYLALSPLLVVLGLHGGASIAVLCTAIAINALVSFRLSRQREPISANDMYFTVIVTALLIGTIARLFSPPLVAPGITTLAVFMFAVDQRIRLLPLIGAMMGAMLLPWGLELLGQWSRTIGSDHGNLVLHSEAFEARYPNAEIALAGFIATLIVFSATFARRVASSERSAVRALELQAWHLRQLVRR